MEKQYFCRMSDGGHLNWPIVDAYLAMYNETIERTER